MGSACAHALAKSGLSVLGLDRFAPPHDAGSTHGETRATRLAVGEGDVYVPLVQRSHEIWRELEQASGESLFEQCGFVTIDSSDGDAQLHGMDGFFERTVSIACRHGIDHEVIDGKEVRQRFAAFSPPNSARCYYEPEGGFVRVEPAISATLDEAERLGATLRLNESYLGHQQDGDGVSVETDQSRYLAGTIVLAGGPWLSAITPSLKPLLKLAPQKLHWVAPTQPLGFENSVCPVYLWLHGTAPDDLFYGFPSAGSAPEIKVATEQYAHTVAKMGSESVIDLPSSDAMIERHLQGRLASSFEPVRSADCMYTITPDHHFIVDRMPDDPKAITISACSGHGFKHAPGIGELVADMIVNDIETKPDFAISRSAIADAMQEHIQ